MQDAEEVTQDVFLTIYQSIENFRAQSSVTTWIYRITINKSLDAIKAKQRKKRFAFIVSLFHKDGEQIKYEPVDFQDPYVIIEADENLKQLLKAIHSLPHQQKTAIILHKMEDLSQQETAAILNISPKAVGALIQRAKNNLSKILNTDVK